MPKIIENMATLSWCPSIGILGINSRDQRAHGFQVMLLDAVVGAFDFPLRESFTI